MQLYAVTRRSPEQLQESGILFPRILLFVAFALFAAAAYAQPERLHRYRVSIDDKLEILRVAACFEGAAPKDIATGSARASQYLREMFVRNKPGRRYAPERGVVSLRGLPDDSCVEYVVDFSAELKWREKDTPRRVGRDLLVAQGLWLWRPQQLADDEDIEIRFDLPEGIAVSAPWRKHDAAYRVGHASYRWPGWIAFGRFEPREIRVGGAVLELAVLDGSPPANVNAIESWLHEAAQAVSSIYGRFPLPSSQLLALPSGAGGEAVPWGQVIRAGQPSAQFFIDQTRPLSQFRADWTAAHELSHMLHPMLTGRDSWLSEGIASYYQNVARARIGLLTSEQAWRELHAGFQRGKHSAQDVSLAEASASMRARRSFLHVYWGGAAIMFLADVELRRRSGNQQSLDSALAGLQACCLPSDRAWSAKEVFDRLDKVTGTRVFDELYDAHLDSRTFPELAPAYALLGLSEDGQLLNAAPMIEVRDTIMRRP